MNRYLLLFVSVVVSGLMMAGNVTPEQAEQAAQQFLSRHRPSLTAQPVARLNMVQHRKTSRRAGAPTAYYVFNVEQENGFVVVSGDDRTVPVLGYAETGSFDEDDMPENMKAWLQSYADQIAWLDAHPETPVASNSTRRAQNVIKPLIQTRWGQNDPYNLFCPMDGEKRCVTGCVATAMAQVMYYYKYPVQTTTTIPTYTTERESIDIDEIGVTTIPWDDMEKTYNGLETDAKKEAVALLMQLCGASVSMDYHPDVSLANYIYVVGGFITYFDYDASTTLNNREHYRAADWDDLIYEELVQKRPVLYGGETASSGHAFVVDGYDGDGHYHVNWGWDGLNDGYFVLSILDPYSSMSTGDCFTPDGFCLGQLAVTGLQPNTGVEPQKPVVMTTNDIFAETTEITASDNKFTLSFKASFYNFTGKVHYIDWGVGVYNMQGEAIHEQQLDLGYFDMNYGCTNKVITMNIPASLSGSYKMMIISREMGSTEWLKNVDSEYYYLGLSIDGNLMKVKNPDFAINAEMAVSGSLEVGGHVKTSTMITNAGTYFNRQFVLRCDDEYVGGGYLDLDGNESGIINILFSPTKSGTKTIELGYKTYSYNERTKEYDKIFNVVASKTVSIAPAQEYSLAFSQGSVTNASGMSINDNHASLCFTVKNTGSNTYDNDLRVYSLKEGNNGYFSVEGVHLVPITLEADKFTQVNCDMPLNADGIYAFIVVYKTNGAFIAVGDSRCYMALAGYNVEIPADEPDGIQTVSSPSATDNQRIYTIGGIQLTPEQFERAPKGLYIVNGRLVTK